MGNVNCLRCRFRHEDNGNCTAVGGFCTAVTAAHCPLLREYLDTGLEPEEINDLASVREISPETEYAINKHADNIIERLDKLLHQTDDDDRLRELAEADKEGRLFLLPLEPGRSMLCQEHFERPWVMKNVAPCVQYQSSVGIVFYMGYDVFRGLVEHGKITPLSPEGEKSLEAMEDD